MENRIEKAIRLFSDNYNCAQSVFSVFAEDLGLDLNTSLKITTPFGGGICGRQKVCGAVTGALMAIGTKYGKGFGDTDEKKTKTREISEEFMQEFEKRNSSLDCIDILGVDMKTEQGQEIIQRENLTKVKCEKCVKDAVELVTKYIE